MTTLPKPMLAPSGEPDLNTLKYPTMASVKMDGVRCLVFDGKMYSRSMEPLHPAVTERFQPIIDIAHRAGVCLDGEIWKEDMPFNKIMHATAHAEECKELRLHVFDILTVTEWYQAVPQTPFNQRANHYGPWCGLYDPEQKHCVPVTQYVCNDAEHVRRMRQEAYQLGYEGLMLKDPNSAYRHSRSTAKQNEFWKLKFWDTLNGKIVGFKQMSKLTEEAKATNTEKSALGRTKRGHKKDDREATEAIGSVEIEVTEGQSFPVGTRFYAMWANEAFDLRTEMTWENRESYLGKHVDVEHQSHGSKDKPRMGRIVRLRPDLD